MTSRMISASTAMALVCLAGCTPVVPKELADARAAYNHAAMGPAAQVAPAELHKAHASLKDAELSFANDPDSQKTRDLAYVAERKAQLADALAAQELDRSQKAQAEQQYQAKQAQIMEQTRGQLNQSKEQIAAQSAQLGQDQQQIDRERQARSDAEQRASAAESTSKELQESLAKLAAVKEEERGLVLTLSGSVLFVTNAAALLPEAQTRLNQVADALMATKDRNVVVEGYTDSRGSAGYNLDLSQRRAEAVRAYLVTRGYPSEKITAQGLGKDRPIADNTSPEGRANNRRVEIVIAPKKP